MKQEVGSLDRLLRFLEESGFDRYLDIEDTFPIDVERLGNKGFSYFERKYSFYFLSEGYVDAYYPDKQGKRHLVARVYATDYQIGGLPGYFQREYSDLNDYMVAFSGGARLHGIREEKMYELLEDNDFLKFILKKNLEHLSKRVQENYFRSVFTVEEYVAYILYTHSVDRKYQVKNYFTFASLVKCDRSSLYRVLSSLEEQGAIMKDGRIINIVFYEALRYIFEEKL